MIMRKCRDPDPSAPISGLFTPDYIKTIHPLAYSVSYDIILKNPYIFFYYYLTRGLCQSTGGYSVKAKSEGHELV